MIINATRQALFSLCFPLSLFSSLPVTLFSPLKASPIPIEYVTIASVPPHRCYSTNCFYEVYPRVKVRVSEQDEDFVCPENDSGTMMFLRFIESLYFEEEKKESKIPPLISKNTKACPQHGTMRSTPSTKGILKSSKRVGESPKGNARASSVIRPRAVLSSPENDGLFGSINDLNNSMSSTKRKNDAKGKMEALCKQVSEGKSLDKGEA
ncbi:hypothetical protein RJT34_22491 [Clitoria ternatea]|uniref:Uncharacterized protein n=1 Tax=Clitoria ternatea TaxID=43366 RepID=A0AAN9IE31_CLITE